MRPPACPPDEEQRQQALQACDVLDSPAEDRYDDLARLAARLFETPMALISLVDADRQWFKARVGFERAETPRHESFCGHVVAAGARLVVADTEADERFRDNPLVLGAPGVRAYAGAPIVDEDGHALGALCVLDTRPREFDEATLDLLDACASQVAALLALRRSTREHELVRRKLHSTSGLLNESQALTQCGGWELDLESGRLTWTAETFRIHDTSADEYTPVTETAIGFYTPESQPVIRAAVEDAMQRGRAYSLDLEIITATGRRKWVRATGAAVARQGRIVRLMGALQDISYQRRLDAELLTAKEAAEAASEAKSAFLAAMSHEIRTPMHTVLGYTDMLRDSELDEEQRECVEVIASSGSSLLRLIDDILDFSKIEAGKMRLEKLSFDLHRTARDVARMMAPLAEPKGLRIRVEAVGIDDAQALADPQRVHQVLVNLVGNAVKFTESGEVVIALSRMSDRLRVGVRDTGIGIPADEQARLFQDFVQVDASTQRRFGGTGLGLAISKQLIESMSGRIGVESAAGAGSTFWFTIPTASSARDDDGGEGAAASRQQSAVAERDDVENLGCRVLVVEDNRLNLRLAVRVLEVAGYDVETAGDGAEALERVASRSYDLVLMDCLMPGMDGFEATRRIREAEARTGAHLPIVALTANALPEDREACLAAGMDDFVSKPFTRQALLQAARRWSKAASKSPADP